MVSVDPSSVLNFRDKPHVDARTGDIILIAYRGLRFIPCRVKRGALKRLAINSVPTEEELLQVFIDYRKRIERLVEERVLSGELSPVISELSNSP
jgi:hypothetical protein